MQSRGLVVPAHGPLGLQGSMEPGPTGPTQGKRAGLAGWLVGRPWVDAAPKGLAFFRRRKGWIRHQHEKLWDLG